MQVKEDRPITVEEMAKLIDIIRELETYGGPTRQTVTHRTAEKLRWLKTSLLAERDNSEMSELFDLLENNGYEVVDVEPTDKASYALPLVGGPVRLDIRLKRDEC